MKQEVNLTNGKILEIKDFFIAVESKKQNDLLSKIIYAKNSESLKNTIYEVSENFEKIQNDNQKVINDYSRYKAAINYLMQTYKDDKEALRDEIDKVNSEYNDIIEAYRHFDTEIMKTFFDNEITVKIEPIKISTVQLGEILFKENNLPIVIVDKFITFTC